MNAKPLKHQTLKVSDTQTITWNDKDKVWEIWTRESWGLSCEPIKEEEVKKMPIKKQELKRLPSSRKEEEKDEKRMERKSTKKTAARGKRERD